VIHACYKNQNGQLRIVDTSQDTCKQNNETAISWNQSGQNQGGATVYSAVNNNQVNISTPPGQDTSGPFQVVALNNRPAGTYLVNATESSQQNFGFLKCYVGTSPTSAYSVMGEQGFGGNGLDWHVAVTDTITLASPGTIALTCQTSWSPNFADTHIEPEQTGAVSDFASITALQVAHLNGN